MPFGNGLEAIRSFQHSKPEVRIIIASGGKRDTEFMAKLDPRYLTELYKPYTIEQLLNAVASAVSGPGHPKKGCDLPIDQAPLNSVEPEHDTAMI
jgi:DNA-binding NarL/FixJ family response regulator